MNPIDDQLHRLFRAAKKPGAAAMTPPFGLETRALAAWRSARSGEAVLWDMTLLRRALVVAIVLMAISIWPVLDKTTDPFSAYLQLADSTTTSDVAP
jgi:hypothetical protein